MNIQQIADIIDDSLLTNGNEKVLPNMVKYFSSKHTLKDLIESAWEQNKDSIIEKSYLHPNGFDKLVLVSGKHFNLRLHNFHPPKVMKPAESVHNHKWEFASSIIHGGYEATEYLVTHGDEQRHHYTYSKEEGLHYVGNAGIEPVDQYEVKAGDSYFMPGDVYHSIKKISDQGCITVMMTGYTKETTTNVFSLTELDPEKGKIHCGLKMYEAQEIESVLNAVKEKCCLN
jgi:hypothetical protein